jgi:hypothetical protein
MDIGYGGWNAETRSDRRKRRNRQALGSRLSGHVTEKGIDTATMSEICELADVVAGRCTIISLQSQISVHVMEQVMDRHATHQAVEQLHRPCKSMPSAFAT